MNYVECQEYKDLVAEYEYIDTGPPKRGRGRSHVRFTKIISGYKCMDVIPHIVGGSKGLVASI